MNQRTQQILATAITVILAVAAAVAGLNGVPARLHQAAEIVLAIVGAIGTALLPGVRVPAAPAPVPVSSPATPPAPPSE
jgi:hypothetical protein